jgi:hypothetical protein
MRRRRASASTPPAAFVRAHCWRSSARGERRAVSSSACSAAASAPAASTIADACSAESSPRRAAADVSGSDSNRRAMSMAAAACTTPVRRASWCAAERSPSARHEPVSAKRAAARALRVAAIFSIREASSTTCSAWTADSRSASNPAAYPLSDSRSSAMPTPMAVPTVRKRATYRGSGDSHYRTGVRILPRTARNASTGVLKWGGTYDRPTKASTGDAVRGRRSCRIARAPPATTSRAPALATRRLGST